MMGSYLLLAIPLFILAAEFMNAGSIMDRLVRFCNAVVGRFRGGLALVSVAQSIVFASMSGSALADAAGTGKLMQSMMTRDGKYIRGFAAALSAVSATIGPILPPSIPLVVYALVSDASVGYLFLAGVIPGLLIGAVQAGLIVAVAKRRNVPIGDQGHGRGSVDQEVPGGKRSYPREQRQEGGAGPHCRPWWRPTCTSRR